MSVATGAGNGAETLIDFLEGGIPRRKTEGAGAVHSFVTGLGALVYEVTGVVLPNEPAITPEQKRALDGIDRSLPVEERFEASLRVLQSVPNALSVKATA